MSGTEGQNVEAEARLVGWVPEAEFKGDKAKWMSAEDFLKRSEDQLPLARANNRALRETNAELTRRLQEMNTQFEELKESVSGLEEFHTAETARRVKAARQALVEQLKAARQAGDVDAEAEILGELTKADTAVENAGPKKEEKPKKPEEVKLDPAFVQWRSENAWFENDKKRRGVAVGIAEDLRADPANNHLQGRAFYDKVAELTEEFFAGRTTTPPSKVEGGGGAGSGGGGGSSERGKGFKDLPAEAKQACDAQAKRQVGKNPKFKTLDDWRAYYAKTYFAAEEEAA